MPYKVSLKDDLVDLDIESILPFDYSLNIGIINGFLALAEDQNRAVALDRITVTLEPGGPPYVYKYHIRTADGRRWDQNITFNDFGDEPSMTFDVTDPWLLREFRPQRQIRDDVVNMVNRFQVTKITLHRTLA